MATIEVDRDGVPGTIRTNGLNRAVSGQSPQGDLFTNEVLPVCVGLGFGSTPNENVLDGAIGEVMVFGGVLDPVVLEAIEGALIEKWEVAR